MKRTFFALFALALLGAQAFAQAPPSPPPSAILSSTGLSLAVTNTTGRVALTNPAVYPVVTLINDGTQELFFAAGSVTVTATTSSIPLPGGSCISAFVGSATNIAAITAANTTTLRIIQSNGQPGVSCPGGGSVTISGAIPAGTNNIGSVELIDSGGTNKAAISAAGAVKVDNSAVTQPVSISQTDITGNGVEIAPTAAAAGARAAGVPFVDTYNAIPDTGNPTSFIDSDNVHPKTAGHALIANHAVAAASNKFYRDLSLTYAAVTPGTPQTVDVTIYGATPSVAGGTTAAPSPTVTVVPDDGGDAGCVYSGYVQANDNVRTIINCTAANASPAAHFFTVTVIQP